MRIQPSLVNYTARCHWSMCVCVHNVRHIYISPGMHVRGGLVTMRARARSSRPSGPHRLVGALAPLGNPQWSPSRRTQSHQNQATLQKMRARTWTDWTTTQNLCSSPNANCPQFESHRLEMWYATLMPSHGFPNLYEESQAIFYNWCTRGKASQKVTKFWRLHRGRPRSPPRHRGPFAGT